MPTKRKKLTPVRFVLVHADFCRQAIDEVTHHFPFWSSIPLSCTSPPYADARTYGIGYKLKRDAWIAWCVERFVLSTTLIGQHNGLNAWVVGHGKRKDFHWNAAPYLLAAALDPLVCLRDPIYYHRNGTPGSGGPDWFRQDVEVILTATKYAQRLTYSNNTACGHPPKYKAGGSPSHRRQDGTRAKPRAYKPPPLSNPGNLLSCGAVGGGNIGSELAHDNEAPFPEKIPDFFIRSFSEEGMWIMDSFSGSGTTLAVAAQLNRCGIGFDIRESQIDLTRRRLLETGVLAKEILVLRSHGALKGV